MELAALYTQERFLAVYSVLRARDWVLDMHGEERPFLAPVIDLFNFGQALYPPPPPPPLPTPHSAPPRPPRSTPPAHPHAPASYALRLQQVGIRASYDDKRQGFAGKTVQPIKAGEELLFYYGNFCIDDAINMCGVAPPLYFPFSPPRIPSLPITSSYIPLLPFHHLTSPHTPLQVRLRAQGRAGVQGVGHRQEANPQIRQGQAMGQGQGSSQGPSQPLIGSRPRAVRRRLCGGIVGRPRPPAPGGGGPETCVRSRPRPHGSMALGGPVCRRRFTL